MLSGADGRFWPLTIRQTTHVERTNGVDTVRLSRGAAKIIGVCLKVRPEKTCSWSRPLPTRVWAWPLPMREEGRAEVSLMLMSPAVPMPRTRPGRWPSDAPHGRRRAGHGLLPVQFAARAT